jgi:spore germination protein
METHPSSLSWWHYLRKGGRELAWVFLATLVAVSAPEAAQKNRPAPQAPVKPRAGLAQARSRVLGARPLALYYYSDDTRGLASLAQHAAEMTLLSPQCFWVDTEGVVHGEVPPQVSNLARRAKLPLMPLVINPGFDRPAASALLRNPRAQLRAVAYLAYLAKRDDYLGFQIDLEYIDPADKSLLSRFVARAAARLHRDGRLLSIAVVPRFSDQFPDQRAAEFRTGEWGAPYDFRALGQAVDFMVLMTYDHHSNTTPPGPVAGYAWMKEALEYAVRRMPRQKILLGIPFYAREWVAASDTTMSRSMTFTDLRALLERPGIDVQWDQRWRAPWFQYRVGSELHTVWFDDERSFREKLGLIRQYRLRGFAAWRLGDEDPAFWAQAARVRKSRPAASLPRARKAEPSARERRIGAAGGRVNSRPK